MKEKERYEYFFGTNTVKDNTNKEFLSYKRVIDTLNQQDKRIKELEKENQQLKQQLKEYSELGTPKEIDDTYRSRNILYNNLQDTNRIIDDLVKQLHDLAKKIVGEIKNLSIFDFKEFEESKIRRYRITETVLDIILKKYGGENESICD